MEKPMSLVVACKHFFGFKPGQTLKEFNDEVKTLSIPDREYFRHGLVANGYPVFLVANVLEYLYAHRGR